MGNTTSAERSEIPVSVPATIEPASRIRRDGTAKMTESDITTRRAACDARLSSWAASMPVAALERFLDSPGIEDQSARLYETVNEDTHQEGVVEECSLAMNAVILSTPGSAKVSTSTSSVVPSDLPSRPIVKPQFKSVQASSVCRYGDGSISALSRPDLRPPFKVPKELEDIIFDMAYPAEDLSNYIAKAAWDEREMEAFRESSGEYCPKPFPSSKVNELLVSRGFYDAASQAWARNQHFDCAYTAVGHCTFRFLPYRFSRKDQHKSFIVDLCARMSIDLNLDCAEVHTLAGLKVLTIRVGSSVFESLEPRFAWKCVLTSEELESIMRSFQLEKLSGLVKFTMAPKQFSYMKTPAHEKQFAENVQALENTVKTIAMRPREVPAETTKKSILQQEVSRLVEPVLSTTPMPSMKRLPTETLPRASLALQVPDEPIVTPSSSALPKDLEAQLRHSSPESNVGGDQSVSAVAAHSPRKSNTPS